MIAAKFESTGGDGGYRLQMESDGDISFGIDDENTSFPEDSVTSTSADYDDNRWHHVAAVKDANNNLYLYIDGNLIDTDATISATDSLDNNDTFYLGIDGDGASNAWTGFIDEFKFYRYARSADEIKADLVKGASVRGAQTSYGIRDYSYLSEGLVGYWKMDEAALNSCTGGTNDACDSSGNGNDGAFEASMTASDFVGAKFGNGVDFDGTDDYVGVTDSTSLDTTADAFTLSAWIYDNDVDDGTDDDRIVVSKGNTGDTVNTTWNFGINDSKVVYLQIADGSSFKTLTGSAGSAISYQTWTHVVATFDGTTMRLYVNGVLSGSPKVSTIGALIDAGDVVIGRQSAGDCGAPYNSCWNGKLDEARIYNRALTPAEIRRLADWAPGPVGYWNFDENTGISTVFDRSGNGNNGTMEGSMTESDWVPGKFGSALEFDGSDDAAKVDNAAIHNLDDSVTVSAWAKFNDVDGSKQSIIGNKQFGGYGLRLNDDTPGSKKIDITIDTTGATATYTAFTTTLVANDTWYYITGVVDGTDLKIYLNGILENTTTSVDLGSSDFDLFLGGDPTGASPPGTLNYPCNCVIDEVKIYNYARTPSQIIEDMNAGHPVGGSPLPSQVGYWRFDEGYGTNANDQSTNNNDLTLSNVSWTNSGKFGKAWNGDGTNWMSRTDDADFDFAAADDFTITLWFKSDSATNPSAAEYVLSKAEASPGYRIFFQSDGDIVFGIDDDTTWTPDDSAGNVGTDYYDANWHYLAALKTGTSKIEIYVDGKLIDSDTTLAATGTLENSVSLVLGDRSGVDGGDEFIGDIDEVKFYRFALTSNQVKLDMNQGKAAVWGATSTDSSGVGTWDAANEYCPPRSSGTCTAPVGEWKFDEKTGTTANDTSGNGNTGSFNGNPTWSHAGECQEGACLDFDGSSDYISTNNGNSVKGLTQVTIEAWFNPSVLDSTSKNIYSEARNTDGSFRLQLAIDSDNRLIFGGRAPDTDSYTTWVDDSRSLSADRWYHLAAVFDSVSDVHHIYLDGQDASASVTEAAFDNTNPETVPKIGAGPNGNEPFPGKIDNVRIYNYARTAAQVAWSYNRGGPVGYWKLDECSGTTANDSGSGGNNGTITIGGTGSNTSAGTCSSGTGTEAWNNGTTGKRNASLDFDGTDDYVDVGSGNSLDITQSITVEGWFSIDSESANYMPVAKWDANGSLFAYLVQIINSTPYFYINPAGAGVVAATSSENLNAGTWYHLAGTYDGDVIRIYVNGIETGSNDITDAVIVSASSTPVYIGAGKNGASLNRVFAGQLDEIKIFNYALTQQQIRNEYNQGAVRYGPATGSP